MRRIIVFILFIFLLNKNIVNAQPKILINEFLIEPQPQQIEIINIGSESADLKDWIIDDDGGSASFFKIEQNSIIYPNSCLTFSSNFYLNTKSSDTIRLIDDNNNIIDSYSYKSSPGQNISFQRIPDGENNWSTQSANIGFFNLTKTPCIIIPTITPISLPTPSPTLIITPTLTITPIITMFKSPTPTIQPISYNNIFISEAMVNPITGEKEWIEFFNNNDFYVFLINWYIDDIEEAGSAPKIFSLEIPPKSYKTIILNNSIFNNSQDQVRLLDFDKNLKDSFEYKSSIQNKTWGRINFENDDFCLQEPSFEKENNFCFNKDENNEKNTSNSSEKLSNNISNLNKNSSEQSDLNKKTKSEKLNINLNKENVKKIANENRNKINYATLNQIKKNHIEGQILGENNLKENYESKSNYYQANKKIINFLSINSIFYIFLTQIMFLIKIKSKYAKIKKFFVSLVYSK